jgi:hypothetical protein
LLHRSKLLAAHLGSSLLPSLGTASCVRMDDCPAQSGALKATRALWREAGSRETLIYGGRWRMCSPDFICVVFSEVWPIPTPTWAKRPRRGEDILPGIIGRKLEAGELLSYLANAPGGRSVANYICNRTSSTLHLQQRGGRRGVHIARRPPNKDDGGKQGLEAPKDPGPALLNYKPCYLLHFPLSQR